jgi:hypothetical protein
MIHAYTATTLSTANSFLLNSSIVSQFAATCLVNGSYNNGTTFGNTTTSPFSVTITMVNRLPAGTDNGMTLAIRFSTSNFTSTIGSNDYYFYDTNNDDIATSDELFGIQYVGTSTANFIVLNITDATTAYHYLLFSNTSTQSANFTLAFSTSTDLNVPSLAGTLTAVGQGIYFLEMPRSTDYTYFFASLSNTTSVGLLFGGMIKSTTQLTSATFPCFLENAMIATIMGEKKIVNIEPNEKIYDGNNNIVTVKNVWMKTCFISSADNNPLTIEKDSFGDNKPNSELLISQHHGVYTEGINGPMVAASKLGLSMATIDPPFNYYNLDLQEGYGTMIVNGLVCETYCSEKNTNMKILK